MTEQDIARLRLLADKFLKNTISDSERAELEAWFREQHDEPLDIPSHFAENEEALESRIFDAIQAKTKQKNEARTRSLWPRIAAAASILIALSAGGYLMLHKKAAPQTAQLIRNDIPPGHSQATLTLANGKQIILTKGLSGNIAKQGNTFINANNNTVSYSASVAQAPITYNTLSTSIGEQSPYPLLLSDGTQVLLDAKSSITFPVAFNGNERRVKITGKAWFKVNPIKDRPFYVDAGSQTTKEIGTEFVVDAYADEPAIRTTLVEGSIMVNNTLLKPGQQAINSGSSIRLKDADLQETLAWVKGNFRYNDESIQYVMRELARWYDIDVQYQGNISTDGFNGKISRYKNISEVLAILESTKLVHFKIEGRRVTVLP